MSVKERIKDYLKHEKISTTSFEKSIEASNGYVNSISKSIGLDKINLIVENYSNLDITWLLTGKGEMLKDEESTDYETVLVYLRDHVDDLLQDDRFNHFMDLILAKREVIKQENDLDSILKDFKNSALKKK